MKICRWCCRRIRIWRRYCDPCRQAFWLDKPGGPPRPTWADLVLESAEARRKKKVVWP